VVAPAIAQSMPSVKWRLTSSFPKSLDTLWGGSELFAKAINEMSDGKFEVRAFAAGEIVPALQVADAVQNGTVEAGQTAAYYYFGKHANFVFETGLPFSINQRQYYAWLYHGGGHELINEFYKEYNFRSFVFGGTGCQMGGWFRKEIKSMDDMKGLKFRVGGFAGPDPHAPRRRAAADRGRRHLSGAREGHDRRLRMGRSLRRREARLQQGRQVLLLSRLVGGRLGRLALHQQRRLGEAAQAVPGDGRDGAGLVTSWMVPKYDAGNPAALRRLVAAGTELRPFPRAVLEPCFAEAYKFYDELAAKDPKFKKIYDSLKAFRADQNLWFRVAENTFDNFNFSMSAQGR
jgi:TRAP-type mannitol/chloroaromatic compound transport system substrate-binding protein